MNRIAAIIKRNRLYFMGFVVYAITGLVLNLAYTQLQLFFFVNSRNKPYFDATMPYITFIGDGIIFITIILLLFFIKIRYGLIATGAWLLSSGIVLVCKQIIFTDKPRPWKRWGEELDVYLVEGFQPYINNSFPSGHTSSAFCMFTILALISARKSLGLLFLILALLVAYSRIYLAQHYFIDTYVGAWVGVLSALIIYYYFYSPKWKFNQQQSRLDQPLLKYKK